MSHIHLQAPAGLLEARLRAASPRFTPGRTPAASWLIHGAVLAVFLLACLRAVRLDGLGAWWVGLIYVGYDTGLLLFTVAAARRLPAPVGASGERPGITVLIAAYNERASLPGTLDSLRAQSEPAELVLVADDGSDDGTASACDGHDEVRLLRLPHGGKAAALNAALIEARTALVVTIDADTHLDPWALAAMRDAFAADPSLVAATGVLRPVCAPSRAGRVLEWFQRYEYVRNFCSRRAWMRAGCLVLLSGAFSGFRRSAVLAVGGFDGESLVEDYELTHRLMRHAGLHGLVWRTAVVGRATAPTDAPATIGDFLRQRRRWFAGFLQTQRLYRDMVGNARFGAVGTRMLPVKAADTVQPIYGLAGLAVLLIAAARGQFWTVGPIVSIMSAKIVLDLAFLIWAIGWHERWTGVAGPSRAGAVAAALCEPFSFQFLRHAGAAWGWLAAARRPGGFR